MKFYRYDSAGGSENPHVFLSEFEATKETRCGWRLSNGKFILKASKKKWAYPTIPEAKQSLIFRKRKHIEILSYRLAHAKAVLALAETSPLPEGPVTFVVTETEFTSLEQPQ